MASHKSPSSQRYWAKQEDRETREILQTRRAVYWAKREISHHWVSDGGVSGYGSPPIGRGEWRNQVREQQTRHGSVTRVTD